MTPTKNPAETYVSIAVPAPLYGTFDYVIPGDKISEHIEGSRALVRFGNRKVVGIILEQKASPDFDPGKVKPIDRLFAEPPSFDGALLSLIKWSSIYYSHPIGECFAAALPAQLKKPDDTPNYEVVRWKRSAKPFQGRKNAHRLIALLETVADCEQGIWDDTLRCMGFKKSAIERLHSEGYLERDSSIMKSQAMNVREERIEYHLNEDQRAALDALRTHKGFAACLLEGVTGSGKTEVYIALARHFLAQGKQALILVPEINLTPQTFRRFQSQLGISVAIYHSGMSDKERFITYSLAQKGEAPVVIGTRSSVFLPFKALGLIVVDEEHDPSYKQNDGFKYSARDLATKRAQIEECTIVLGSATPSAETLSNAIEGRFEWHKLKQRANTAEMPEVFLEDMRTIKKQEHFSPRALEAIKRVLDAGDQAIIFQNRRGFAPSLMCFECGWLCNCPFCDARLTVHLHPAHLHCHHCDYKSQFPKSCSTCGANNLRPVGAGTERLEQTLNYYFPNTPCFRMDRDQIKTQSSLDQILENIQSGEPAIIVGTQMLAKGHDFPNVTLVVVIDADSLFFSSDYRALERGAQQLMQVAGRTGRGEKAGRVLIQTRLPDHELFDHIRKHDYLAFMRNELETRKACHLPPYSRMLTIRSESRSEEKAQHTLDEIKSQLSISNDSNVFLAGPMPAAITRKQNVYRYLLHVFCPDTKTRTPIQSQIVSMLSSRTFQQVKISLDIDPLEFI